MKQLNNNFENNRLLFWIRAVTLFYIFALFFWGVTAFPIESELRVLTGFLGIEEGVAPENYGWFRGWLAYVFEGVVQTNSQYPFLAYGTDWLAFSHIVIGVAFMGLYANPVRNVWIVYFGMIACIGVIPLALICGAVRGIPLWWRLIDCSFCLTGMVPLILLHFMIGALSKSTQNNSNYG